MTQCSAERVFSLPFQCERKWKHRYRMILCLKNSIPICHVNQQCILDPTALQYLSNPSSTAVTPEPRRQKNHLCWTFSLHIAWTMIHGLFKIFLLRQVLMVCVWLFTSLVLFCGGGREVPSLAALSSRSATTPVSKTSDRKYAALVYGVYFIKTA